MVQEKAGAPHYSVLAQIAPSIVAEYEEEEDEETLASEEQSPIMPLDLLRSLWIAGRRHHKGKVRPRSQGLWSSLQGNQSGVTPVLLYLVSAAAIDEILSDTDKRLDDLNRLPENWYVHGANPISSAVTSRAKRLMRLVSDSHLRAFPRQIRPSAVVPLANGAVQLEWKGPGGWLEVEIPPSGQLEFSFELGVDPNIRFEDGEISDERVSVLLNRIL